VVTGATRGVGRGVARAFGASGATVYVTGRTTAGSRNSRSDEAVLPGNLEECVAEVTAAGGKGIPVRCDLADDAQVLRLFQRVKEDCGRLDVLVNNAAFLHEDMAKQVPFWERSPRMADILDVGLRCHYLAIHCAAPLMLQQNHGLILPEGSVALESQRAVRSTFGDTDVCAACAVAAASNAARAAGSLARIRAMLSSFTTS
jgi:NAD(P)-dependent dehydrogenase (short-subunit alcohol dehydrogenase family)